VAFPFPQGVSGLFDPDDELYIDLFEACAASRRRLGLPSYTREEIELLFCVKDAPAPSLAYEPLPPNVLALPLDRRPRRRRRVAPPADAS